VEEKNCVLTSPACGHMGERATYFHPKKPFPVHPAPQDMLCWGVVFEEITRYSITSFICPSVIRSFVVSVCRLPAAIYTRRIHEPGSTLKRLRREGGTSSHPFSEAYLLSLNRPS
jgi:hypothetical protein